MTQKKTTLAGILAEQQQSGLLGSEQQQPTGLLSGPLEQVAGALYQQQALPPDVESILKGTPWEGAEAGPMQELIKMAGSVHSLPKIDIYPVFTPGSPVGSRPVGYMGNAMMGGNMITAPVSPSPAIARQILMLRLLGK